jgi:hypothetical protein
MNWNLKDLDRMKKFLTIALIFALSSCASYGKILEQKAKHQANTGNRINEAQKNTNSLFDEL